MDLDLCKIAIEVFPEAPDCIALFPAVGQQRVVAALQQDVAAGRHLLCISGPAGSGKTVLLRDLRQSFRRGLVGMVEQPVPGRVLFDVAKSLQLGAEDDNETSLRRRLAMRLSMAIEQRQPIILIVDEADRLPTEDLNLLLHFFQPGHATLILAGRAAPETWLSGCTTPTGDVHIDHCYNVDPLSAEETVGYIRHRLHMAALPEDLFEPAILTLIHQMNGGVPGEINKFCAGALARTGTQARVGLVPPTSEPGLVIGQGSRLPQATLDEISTPENTTVPQIERQHEVEPPAQLVVATQEIRDEPERLSWRIRRLQRSVWIWRALAMVVSVALTVELTKDTWLDHMSTNYASLWGLAESPSEPVESKRSLPDYVQSSVLDGSTDAAELSSNTELHSDLASPYAQYFLREETEMPLFLYTMDDSDTASPQWTISVPTVPGYVRKLGADLAADAAGQDAKTDQDGFVRGSASPRPARGSTRMTRTQRQEIARLYAERAEIEFRNGEEGAASLSIQRGLASDPRNPRLLEMRVKVLEALRRP